MPFKGGMTDCLHLLLGLLLGAGLSLSAFVAFFASL
jgi:hypothetical protein